MPFTHPIFNGVAEAVRKEMYKVDNITKDLYSEKAIEAAQRVLEHWFYENVGIDMDSADYEELTRIMFNAAKEAE